ncbi:MAG: hypothetical protein H6970_15450 [Gammaproteobacteria bacterium]|nr:hypothetical protein [Gammaproteobacteria bacterium]
MSTDRINWIDLSDYGITLHALRLPSQRVVLVAAGNTRAHEAALAALGFRRTRQGHVVHPETKLALKTVQAQFPLARVAALAREQVIRIVPARIAPAIPFSPQETVERLPADGGAPPNSDHLIHGAVWLGVNRRGQAVYSDGADNRYLEGLAREDFGPESDVDFLRAPTAAALPEMMLGMARRAAQGEHLHADDLLQLARHIEAPWWDRPPEERLHTLQEALEVAATHFIRTHYGSGEPWQDDHQKGKSLYRAAVHLNAHLPTVQRRTDETLRLAQFSSPLPLAIAMRTLLGPIGSNRTVLEPTAGHGALLQGLPTDTRITAVEISPERAERLRWAWGDRAEIVTGDILKTPFPEEPYDYILANPPYGALAHYPDWPSTAQVRFGDIQFPTRRLDQLILLQTLKQRHPQGRAVFLIGAVDILFGLQAGDDVNAIRCHTWQKLKSIVGDCRSKLKRL